MLGHLLRRIAVRDEQNARETVLLTKVFHPAASTLAAGRRERGQAQIWTALIVMLLVKCLQLPLQEPQLRQLP